MNSLARWQILHGGRSSFRNDTKGPATLEIMREIKDDLEFN